MACEKSNFACCQIRLPWQQGAILDFNMAAAIRCLSHGNGHNSRLVDQKCVNEGSYCRYSRRLETYLPSELI